MKTRRRGGGKEKTKSAKKASHLKFYSMAEIGRMGLENIARSRFGTKPKSLKKVKRTVATFTKKLHRGEHKKSATGKARKYNIRHLKHLVGFLDELERIDEEAIETDNNELREKLSIFTTLVIGDLKDVFENLRSMLPDDEVHDDLDSLIGVMSGMKLENDADDELEKAKDLIEKLEDEYRSNNILPEARIIYGYAIEMLVDAFINAITKHSGELRTRAPVAAAPANNGLNALMNAFNRGLHL